MRKLTKKQKLFVCEYLVDLNATQAAIRAGYSEKTAKVIGYENLTKPDIAEAINQATEKRQEKAGIDAEWVLNQQVRVFNRCMQDEVVRDKEGEELGQYKFEHTGANKALENIGKHVNVQAFNEKHTIGGDDSAPPIRHSVSMPDVAAALKKIVGKL